MSYWKLWAIKANNLFHLPIISFSTDKHKQSVYKKYYSVVYFCLRSYSIVNSKISILIRKKINL